MINKLMDDRDRRMEARFREKQRAADIFVGAAKSAVACLAYFSLHFAVFMALLDAYPSGRVHWAIFAASVVISIVVPKIIIDFFVPSEKLKDGGNG